MTTLSVVGNSLQISDNTGILSLLPQGAYSLLRKSNTSTFEVKNSYGIKVAETDLDQTNLMGTVAERLELLEEMLTGQGQGLKVLMANVDFDSGETISVLKNTIGGEVTVTYDNVAGEHKVVFDKSGLDLGAANVNIQFTPKADAPGFQGAYVDAADAIAVVSGNGGADYVLGGFLSVTIKE